MYQNIIERFKKLDERIDDLENYVGIGEDGSSTLLDEIKNILASINFSPIKKIMKLEGLTRLRTYPLPEPIDNPDKCIVIINTWVEDRMYENGVGGGQSGDPYTVITFSSQSNIVSYTLDNSNISLSYEGFSDGGGIICNVQIIEFN